MIDAEILMPVLAVDEIVGMLVNLFIAEPQALADVSDVLRSNADVSIFDHFFVPSQDKVVCGFRLRDEFVSNV